VARTALVERLLAAPAAPAVLDSTGSTARFGVDFTIQRNGDSGFPR
jgi:hypothetical protein